MKKELKTNFITILILYCLTIISIPIIFATNGCSFDDPICTATPTNNCDVRESLTFTQDNYDLPLGVDICGENIVLDCNGAVLNGGQGEFGIGILALGQDDFTIRNCNVANYDVGIFLFLSSNAIIENSNAYDNLGSMPLGDDNETGYGIILSESFDTVITNSSADDNNFGLFSTISDDSYVENSRFCFNLETDIEMENSTGTGEENTCDNSNGWNDDGFSGCTFSCELAIAECNSCGDCEAKLNGDFDLVLLQNDISTIDSTCIIYNSSSTTFDCQGYSIEGIDTGEFDEGIFMEGKTGNTIQNCKISGFESAVVLSDSQNIHLINNTLFSNLKDGIFLGGLLGSDNNIIENNTIFQNGVYGIEMASSNTNFINNNYICDQGVRDIKSVSPASGNSRSGNICDKIDNWNDDQEPSSCEMHCTGDAKTTCDTEDTCQDALNGDFGYVTLDENISAPDGFVANASWVTFDCNGHEILGNKSSSGFFIFNEFGWEIKNCTFRNYKTGIDMLSSSLNNINFNNLLNNTIGISNSISVEIPRKNNITDNLAKNNSEYGILLDTTEKNIIKNNFLVNNDKFSIWIRGLCNNEIEDNVGGEGNNPIFYWHDTFTDPNIAGDFSEVIYCNVSNTQLDGVNIDNGNIKNDGILLVDSFLITLEDNLISNSNGIHILDSDSIIVRNNTVRRSQVDGITTEFTEFSVIYNNSVNNNVNGTGILLSSVSDFTRVYNNSIYSNLNGIRISGSDDVEVYRNLIFENKENGIELQDAKRTNIYENEVLENKNGLFFFTTANSSTVNENYLCFNSNHDIEDNGDINTGDNNSCIEVRFWQDESAPGMGCANQCVGWYNWNYGFTFENRGVDVLSYKRYAQTFGESEVYASHEVCLGLGVCGPIIGCKCLGEVVSLTSCDLGQCIPAVWPAIYYGAVYWWSGFNGLCYGIATSSLRFFYGDDHFSSYGINTTSQKNLTFEDMQERTELHFGSQLSLENFDFYSDNIVGPENEAPHVLDKAREGLRNRNPGFLAMVNDIFSFEAHVVNYDTVEDFDNGSSRIYVYDNNRNDTVLSFSTNKDFYYHVNVERDEKNTWNFQMADGTLYNNGMIFDIPYSISNKGDWTLPLSLQGLLIILFGDSESVQGNIEDLDGNIMGFDEFGNTYQDIASGMVVPVWLGDSPDQGGLLPDLATRYLVWPGGDYNMNIFGKNGGEYTEIVAGLNTAYILENITATTSTKDLIEFRIINGNPMQNEMSLQTNHKNKLINIQTFKFHDEGIDNRQYKISNMMISNESKVFVKTSSDYNSLVVANRGSDILSYDIKFQNQMVNIDSYKPGEIPILLIMDLEILPNETQTITPKEWISLFNSTINVHTESFCGDLVCGIGEDHVNCPADCQEIECVTPFDDISIYQSTTFCNGIYNIPDTKNEGVIRIRDSDLVLDCNGAKFIGNGIGTGIYTNKHATRLKNITIKNCLVQNYSQGVFFTNIKQGNVHQSAIESNSNAGIKFQDTGESQIINNFIENNLNGITIENALDTTVSKNLICPNHIYDIKSINSVGNVEDSNACDSTSQWDDENNPGCTLKCSCTFDLDGDGTIGPSDLVILLGAWGPNPGHVADFDNDGIIGTNDLMLLLGSWGPCFDDTKGTTYNENNIKNAFSLPPDIKVPREAKQILDNFFNKN